MLTVYTCVHILPDMVCVYALRYTWGHLLSDKPRVYAQGVYAGTFAVG